MQIKRLPGGAIIHDIKATTSKYKIYKNLQVLGTTAEMATKLNLH